MEWGGLFFSFLILCKVYMCIYTDLHTYMYIGTYVLLHIFIYTHVHILEMYYFYKLKKDINVIV